MHNDGERGSPNVDNSQRLFHRRDFSREMSSDGEPPPVVMVEICKMFDLKKSDLLKAGATLD